MHQSLLNWRLEHQRSGNDRHLRPKTDYRHPHNQWFRLEACPRDQPHLASLHPVLSRRFHQTNLQSLRPLLPVPFYLNLVHRFKSLSFPITRSLRLPSRNPHRPRTSPLRSVGFKVAVSCKTWSEPVFSWRMHQNLSRVPRRRGLAVHARVPSANKC